MDINNQKEKQAEEKGPGGLSSYNNREDNREGKIEETSEGRDVSESYMDYNGNSEANEPARTDDDEK